MGKGDKKSRKGKIFQGSYGKTRPKKRKKAAAPAKKAAAKKAPAKKAAKKSS
jgi:30S ribosomal protein S31